MKKSFAAIYEQIPRRIDEKHYHRCREYIGSDNVDFEGRQVSGSVLKLDNPTNRYKGLNANDFCLENQLAVGVSLNPVRCSLVNSSEEDSLIK